MAKAQRQTSSPVQSSTIGPATEVETVPSTPLALVSKRLHNIVAGNDARGASLRLDRQQATRTPDGEVGGLRRPMADDEPPPPPGAAAPRSRRPTDDAAASEDPSAEVGEIRDAARTEARAGVAAGTSPDQRQRGKHRLAPSTAEARRAMKERRKRTGSGGGGQSPPAESGGKAGRLTVGELEGKKRACEEAGGVEEGKPNSAASVPVPICSGGGTAGNASPDAVGGSVGGIGDSPQPGAYVPTASNAATSPPSGDDRVELSNAPVLTATRVDSEYVVGDVVHATPVTWRSYLPQDRRVLACLVLFVLAVVGVSVVLSQGLDRPKPPPVLSPGETVSVDATTNPSQAPIDKPPTPSPKVPSQVPTAAPSQPPTTAPSHPPTTESPTPSPTVPPRDWFKVQSIREGADDEFGYSIDLSGPGTHLAVGTVNGGDDGRGFVRVYEQRRDREDGEPSWAQVGPDIVSDSSGAYLFGTSVSISDAGNVVVVTASGDPAIVAAYEYSSAAGGWSLMETDTGGPIAENVEQGGSLALSGDGSYLAAVLNEPRGEEYWNPRVRVYESFRGWSEVYQQGEQSELLRGESVAISTGKGGTLIAIGDPGEYLYGGRGTVRVLRYSHFNGKWTQVGNTIEGRNMYDYIGEAVALSEDGFIVAIGSGQSDRGGLGNTGLVTVFRYVEEEDVWTRMGNEVVGDHDGDAMGMTISLSADGTRLLVGSQFSIGRSEKGYVRAFRYDGRSSKWMPLGDDLVGEVPLEEFGFSLSMSAEGNRIAISAPDQSNDSVGTGYVNIYELQDV